MRGWSERGSALSGAPSELSEVFRNDRHRKMRIPKLFPTAAFATVGSSLCFSPQSSRSVAPRLTTVHSPLHPSSPLKSTLSPAESKTVPSSTLESTAAQWHRQRRKQMLKKYGGRIARMETKSSSQALALPLLLLANLSLGLLSLWSGSLNLLQVLLLSIFPGSMFSLWQLQILHDCLHGSLLRKGVAQICGKSRRDIQNAILFWGSMPSVFGYYLYLKFGHLTHHRNVGDVNQATLERLFDSNQTDFEDGDVLFVAHRMKLKGEVGPKFKIPAMFGKAAHEIKMSISKSGFNRWRVGKPTRNTLAFALSFMFERLMLMVNDAVVAASGTNFFFPNKPREFHKACATYCRCAVLVRAALWAAAGWKSLLFLYLSETLWSIPPHPACAMFVTNHGSKMDETTGNCIPSSSTYAGRWYSIFTLGTNYHCEHHDFPTIPLHRLGKLRQIAPEFYRQGTSDNVFRIMKGAFDNPDFYACLDAGVALD